MAKRALGVVVHGHSKVGKTTFAMTAPYPRLLLDVEAAARFLPNKMIEWDPLTQPVPVADGTWDTCVVDIDNFAIAQKAFDVLKSGRHQFRSVILDSVSELQAKVIEDINSRMQFQTQHWGQLLTKLSFYCRDLRDLLKDKKNPIEVVVITAMTKKYDTKSDGSGGIYKPFLQGQISAQLPYWFDVTSYLFEQQVMDPDTKQPVTMRRLLCDKNNEYEAGNRANIPPIVDYPSIEKLLDFSFGPRVVEANPGITTEVVDTSTGEIHPDAVTVQSETNTVKSNGMQLPKTRS